MIFYHETFPPGTPVVRGPFMDNGDGSVSRLLTQDVSEGLQYTLAGAPMAVPVPMYAPLPSPAASVWAACRFKRSPGFYNDGEQSLIQMRGPIVVYTPNPVYQLHLPLGSMRWNTDFDNTVRLYTDWPGGGVGQTIGNFNPADFDDQFHTWQMFSDQVAGITELYLDGVKVGEQTFTPRTQLIEHVKFHHRFANVSGAPIVTVTDLAIADEKIVGF